jgi:hypothetical protein
MPHADTDPVILTYSSDRNISFHGTIETGYTWGEWRDMIATHRDEAIDDAVYNLIDITVVDDED